MKVKTEILRALWFFYGCAAIAILSHHDEPMILTILATGWIYWTSGLLFGLTKKENT